MHFLDFYVESLFRQNNILNENPKYVQLILTIVYNYVIQQTFYINDRNRRVLIWHTVFSCKNIVEFLLKKLSKENNEVLNNNFIRFYFCQFIFIYFILFIPVFNEIAILTLNQSYLEHKSGKAVTSTLRFGPIHWK